MNLEPVYAITLSILLLGEQRELDQSFYVGVVIILACIFIYALVQRSGIKPVPIN